VADQLPPKTAQKILAQCTTEESLLLAGGDSCNSSGGDDDSPSLGNNNSSNKISHSHGNIYSTNAVKSNATGNNDQSAPKQHARILMEPDYRLIESLITSQQNFVLSDPSLPDNPIVYASDGFCKLSGYKRNEIIGRNCRFLQGEGYICLLFSFIVK
jgi:hypothetical protein